MGFKTFCCDLIRLVTIVSEVLNLNFKCREIHFPFRFSLNHASFKRSILVFIGSNGLNSCAPVRPWLILCDKVIKVSFSFFLTSIYTGLILVLFPRFWGSLVNFVTPVRATLDSAFNIKIEFFLVFRIHARFIILHCSAPRRSTVNFIAPIATAIHRGKQEAIIILALRVFKAHAKVVFLLSLGIRSYLVCFITPIGSLSYFGWNNSNEGLSFVRWSFFHACFELFLLSLLVDQVIYL
jgi:hypothetical protein